MIEISSTTTLEWPGENPGNALTKTTEHGYGSKIRLFHCFSLVSNVWYHLLPMSTAGNRECLYVSLSIIPLGLCRSDSSLRML